jgi:outer membrane receptor protein involved in Fe transport
MDTVMNLRRSIFLFLIFFLVWVLNVRAQQTGTIHGFLVDANTNEPLIGVSLSFLSIPIGTVTDIDGRFFLSKIPYGTYQASFSFLGYVTNKMEIIVDSDTLPLITVELVPQSDTESILDIEPCGPSLFHSAPTRWSMSERELRSLPITYIEELLPFQPGALTDRKGNVYYQGGRSYSTEYMIDGFTADDASLIGPLQLPVGINAIVSVETPNGGFTSTNSSLYPGSVQIITKRIAERSYSGSVSLFGGDFFTANNAMLHLNNHELRQRYAAANIGGPVPGLNTLSFFVSGQWIDEKNQFYGQRKFTIDNYRTSVPEGDMAFVAMSPVKRNMYQAVLHYNPVNKLMLGYSLYGRSSESKTYDHFYRYNPGFLPTTYTDGDAHTMRASYMFSPLAFSELSVQYKRFQTETYVFSDPLDVRYIASRHNDNPPAVGTMSNRGVDNTRSIGETKTLSVNYDFEFLLNSSDQLRFGFDAAYNDLMYNKKETKLKIDTAGMYVPDLQIRDSYSKSPLRLGMYIQETIMLDAFQWFWGVRYDRIDARSRVPVSFFDNPQGEIPSFTDAVPKNHISPRIGMTYRWNERTELFASFGKFVSLPPLQLFYLNSLFNVYPENHVGNAELDFEESRVLEIGLQRTVGQSTIAEATFFYRTMVSTVGIEYHLTRDFWRYNNSGSGKVKGAMVTATVRPVPFLFNVVSGKIAYTFQQVEDIILDPVKRRLGNPLYLKPVVHQLSPFPWEEVHMLSVILNITDDVWGAGVNGFYRTGTLRGEPGFVPASPDQEESNALALSIRLWRNFTIRDYTLQIFMDVKNIFDSHQGYSAPAVSPEEDAWHSNQYPFVNTLSEFYNDPLDYPQPRLILAGFRFDF